MFRRVMFCVVLCLLLILPVVVGADDGTAKPGTGALIWAFLIANWATFLLIGDKLVTILPVKQNDIVLTTIKAIWNLVKMVMNPFVNRKTKERL